MQRAATSPTESRSGRNLRLLPELPGSRQRGAASNRIIRLRVGPTHLVNRGVARAEQGHPLIDQERNAAAQLERSGQEGVLAAHLLQLDRLPGFARIQCSLDALGIELLLIGFIEFVVGAAQHGRKLYAAWRNDRLLDAARILRPAYSAQGERHQNRCHCVADLHRALLHTALVPRAMRSSNLSENDVCLRWPESAPPRLAHGRPLKDEEAARQQGSLFFGRIVPTEAKPSELSGANTMRRKMQCQGENSHPATHTKRGSY